MKPKVDDYNWRQEEVIHCPDINCPGMLLSNKYEHEHKCSKCGKYWFAKIEWIEVKDFKRSIE